MSLSVTKVGGRDDLERFLLLPYRIYANDERYVFPLLSEQRHFFDPAKNPFHAHAKTCLWTANRDGEVVGRIGACVDEYHNRAHDEQTGFFGFFETEDDLDISRALLTTARDWLRDAGVETMRGPSCFTSNHDFFGLLYDGEISQPVVGMPYNPRYYIRHLEEFGLTKCKDLYAWRIETNKRIPPKVQGLIDSLLGAEAFSVRPFRMDRFDEDADIVRQLYNACWAENWGFVPMDDAEFAYIAKDMKSMVNANFLLIAEAQGQPIGFCMTIPDFNQALKPCRGKLFPLGWLKFLLGKRRINYARTLLMGVLPEFRRKGVDVVMVYKTMQYGFSQGISAAECSWTLEDNRAINTILKGYGCELYKTYRIYDLSLA